MPAKARASQAKPATASTRNAAVQSTSATKRRANTTKTTKSGAQTRAVKPAAPRARAATPKAPTRSPAKAKQSAVVKSVLPQVSKQTKTVKKTPLVPVVQADKKAKPGKPKKTKLVRDSFTMPDTEYAHIAALKKRCLKAGMAAKKSEVLRAAVANLIKLGDEALMAAMRGLEVIKTGRPAKGRK